MILKPITHLTVAALICEVTGMDEDIAGWELDGRLVRIRDADDARPARSWTGHRDG